ncbi:MAG: isoprenylcysteine carboxylmethyltransferase family protein [Bacteroidales bacterium]|nr:isoprenylcysteine carboxylmethyltransferase family protein [Bacteroidales bacterium]
MNTTTWIIFIILTLANIWLTWWVSLRQKRFHGIYRFISFECIFLLVLMNYPVWFSNPFAWHQIISWILLIGSTLIAVFGFYLLYHLGKPSDQLEDTTQVISSGLFRYIRHPLYMSLILGGFAVMMKQLQWPQIIMSLVNLLVLWLTARVEEGEMIRKFGQEYVDYMKKTKMFIPYLL